MVYDSWPFRFGYYKVPTVLKYNESFELLSWGWSALESIPSKGGELKIYISLNILNL